MNRKPIPAALHALVVMTRVDDPQAWLDRETFRLRPHITEFVRQPTECERIEFGLPRGASVRVEKVSAHEQRRCFIVPAAGDN